MPVSSWRRTVSGISAFVSRLLFAATIILIPFRTRLILVARPQPPLYRDFTDYLLFAADATLILTLAVWAVSLLASPRKIGFGPRHVWIPLLTLTLVGGLSTMTSVDPALSGYQGIRLLVLFWFYVFFINEIGSLRWILAPVLLQAAVQSVIALAQFIAQRSVDLQGIGELSLDPAWSGISIVVAHGVRLLRAYGLTDHPNILGGCLAFATVLLLGTVRPGRSPMLAIAGLLPALLVTFSRSAWLAFLCGAGFLVVLLVLRRRWEPLRYWSHFAVAGLVMLMPFLLAYARFFGARLNADQSFTTPSVEQQAIGERVLLANAALPLLVSYPLLGIGLGASPIALHLAYPDSPFTVEPPHLTFLDAAVETGILGGVSYLALGLAPLLVFYRQRATFLANPLACAAIALLLSITIVGFFDYYTWLLLPGRLWQWLAWGLWGSVAQGRLAPSVV